MRLKGIHSEQVSLDNGSGRGKGGVRGNLEEEEGYAQGRKRVCRRLMSVLEEFSRSGGVHWSVIFGVCASGDSILTFCVCKRMEQNLTPTDVVPV